MPRFQGPPTDAVHQLNLLIQRQFLDDQVRTRVGRQRGIHPGPRRLRGRGLREACSLGDEAGRDSGGGTQTHT